VRRFQAGEVPVFLISLKAGGVGLNLTAADTVIHYDPWWNPAAEDQATDRAHRIGQDKPVFVHRLVALQSIEEKMELLKERKRALVATVLQGEEGGALRLTEADVEELFAPM
jgi:SNF2 family DNA or RNA helicase